MDEEDKSSCHYITMVSYFTTIVFSVVACGVFTWNIYKDERESIYGSSMHLGWFGAGMAVVFVVVKIDTWCDLRSPCGRRREYEAV